MRLENVAIVGSGVAGVHAAQQLAAKGIQVSVFDKSRGTGGRVASCRLGDRIVDLGAPLIQAESRPFADWLQALGAQYWKPVGGDFTLAPRRMSAGWVGSPSLSALTRGVVENSEGIRLFSNTRVGVVWPDREGVLLRDTDGESLGYFDAALIATPAPQAAALLDAVHRFQQRAERADVEPVWTLVVELSGRPEHLRGLDVLEGDHPVFRRIVRDSSKPDRVGECWVLEARSDWSCKQLNATGEQVARSLIAEFEKVAGENIQPLQQRSHRWLYARARPQADSPAALWDAYNSIGACGDWLLGGTVEGAWMSAEALVNQMLTPDRRVA